jgi:hypothetical protein
LDRTGTQDSSVVVPVTYVGFAAAWPPREGAFADKMNGMPKYVVSSTLDELEWNNSTLVTGERGGRGSRS